MSQTHQAVKKPLILVTGSTGKTGAPVVEQLLERGYPVRALVHKIDGRSQRLESIGAEVVQGGLLDLASVRAAVKGVKRMYFVYPPYDRLLEATSNVAVAARDEGIEAVVNMSQISAREHAPSPLSRQHWLAERVLDWAGVGASHVNPTFFAEDLYLFTGRSIAEEGKMYLPFGEGRHAPVAAEDIARVVVGILENPTPHLGQRYAVTGPRDMKMSEVAEVFSTELGRPITYVDLPVEHWKEVLVKQPEFPEFLAAHLAAVAKDHQDGVFSARTDVVETIGGQAPQSLRDFIRANKPEFTAEPREAVA